MRTGCLPDSSACPYSILNVVDESIGLCGMDERHRRMKSSASPVQEVRCEDLPGSAHQESDRTLAEQM